MLGDIWSSSELTAEKLGITEIKLSLLRENGILKPGIHWKSSPLGQKKPWKPKALYNLNMSRNIINKIYFEESSNNRNHWTRWKLPCGILNKQELHSSWH